MFPDSLQTDSYEYENIKIPGSIQSTTMVILLVCLVDILIDGIDAFKKKTISIYVIIQDTLSDKHMSTVMRIIPHFRGGSPFL